MTITVRYHESADELQALSHYATGPFDRPDWFALLHRHGYPALFAVARDETGEAAALALMPAGAGLAALVNWFSFTWAPLVPPGAAGARLLAALARDLRRRAGRLTLAPLAAEDLRTAALIAALRGAGWAVFAEECDENHALAVAGRSFDAYWSQRPGRLRTTLKRKGGKVDTRILTRFDPAAWAQYRAVYEGSWKPAEERADLLEAFAQAEGAAGRLRLGLAERDGETVAAQFWTVENGTAYIHKLAHLPAAEPVSAGTTLSAALMRHVINTDGVSLVDFGTGGDGYKRDWMDTRRARVRIEAFDPRRPAVWPALARRALRRLASRDRPA